MEPARLPESVPLVKGHIKDKMESAVVCTIAAGRTVCAGLLTVALIFQAGAAMWWLFIAVVGLTAIAVMQLVTARPRPILLLSTGAAIAGVVMPFLTIGPKVAVASSLVVIAGAGVPVLERGPKPWRYTITQNMEDEFRTRMAVAAAALALVATGCTSLTVSQPTSTTLTTVQLDTSTASTEQTLELPAGKEVRTLFEFEAPDPAEHAFDVEFVMPVDTELEVTFVTADDVTLTIFYPLRAAGLCEEEAGQLSCLLHFPILEARRSGTWTAEVKKLSTPAAEVTISVAWLPTE